MIRLRAKVPCEQETGEQSPASRGNERRSSEKGPQIPIPQWIEIEEGHEGGYLLTHIYLREGPFVHTWHATLEEAKAEAKVEFSVGEDEWMEQPELSEARKKGCCCPWRGTPDLCPKAYTSAAHGRKTWV